MSSRLFVGLKRGYVARSRQSCLKWMWNKVQQQQPAQKHAAADNNTVVVVVVGATCQTATENRITHTE